MAMNSVRVKDVVYDSINSQLWIFGNLVVVLLHRERERDPKRHSQYWVGSGSEAK